jgi:AraC-like DNA-binding protein
MFGLEQQLIQALIDCLSGEPVSVDTASQHRRHELMARFEQLLLMEPGGDVDVGRISGALGVSNRLLRRCCLDRLGMSPRSYLKLRRLQCAYRDLRHSGPYRPQVSEVAQRHGFGDLGRFAAAYRGLFGELPSMTVQRGLPRELSARAKRRRTGVGARGND